MKIFFAQADFGGCGFYRILQPAAFLKFYRRHEVTLGFKFNILQLLDYDLIVFQRQYLPQVVEHIKLLHEHKKKVIYEIDDDMWHVPAENDSKKFWGNDKIANAEAIMHKCDAITTTTAPLEKLLLKHNERIYVIPNYVPEITPQPKFESIIKIGWSGSISHKVDFDENITGALLDIKKKYKKGVELVFCGWVPDKLIGQVTFYEGVPPMDYLSFLNELRLHIGIIPSSNIVFNESKSNLKFLEYSITKTVSIASSIYPYVNTITDDNGILIKEGSRDEWYEAIDKLIQDVEFRNRLADNAYEYVRSNYLIADNIGKIEKVYQEILAL